MWVTTVKIRWKESLNFLWMCSEMWKRNGRKWELLGCLEWQDSSYFPYIVTFNLTFSTILQGRHTTQYWVTLSSTNLEYWLQQSFCCVRYRLASVNSVLNDRLTHRRLRRPAFRLSHSAAHVLVALMFLSCDKSHHIYLMVHNISLCFNACSYNDPSTALCRLFSTASRYRQ